MNGLLPPGTLVRLERLLSRAQRVSDEAYAVARAISVELRAVALAINSAQQINLPLPAAKRGGRRPVSFDVAMGADLKKSRKVT